MRPYYRNVGLSVILVAGGMTIVSLIAWCTQPPNDPVRMPFVITIFFLFTLLGVYLLLLHTRYRLLVADSMLRQIGVFRDNQVDLDAVDELKWRRFPQGGSVLMTGRTTFLKIELGNFERADRQSLVEFLRRSIPESQQTGWQQFDEYFSGTPEKEKQATRVYFLLLAVFGAHTIAFGIMWAIGAGLQYLVFSGINAMMVAYMLWSRRRKETKHGKIVSEPTDEREPDCWIVCGTGSASAFLTWPQCPAKPFSDPGHTRPTGQTHHQMASSYLPAAQHWQSQCHTVDVPADLYGTLGSLPSSIAQFPFPCCFLVPACYADGSLGTCPQTLFSLPICRSRGVQVAVL